MNPKVTVVLLNWNGRHWLEQFLPSVLQSTYQPFEILVVDNASSDDSIKFLQAHYPTIRLLELDQNYGFAEGNNRALPHIDSPYFVLLNSDVEVEAGWLEPLVDAMESRPELASVQPKIRSWNKKDHFEYAGAAGGFLDAWGYPFCRGRIFDDLEQDLGQYDEPIDIFWATGACCLIRTSVVQKIGLFDADFFAHMEEIDFCWRAQNHGYKIGVCPHSIVYHVGGGTLPQGNPRKTYLNVRNNLAMLYKNLPGSLLSRIKTRIVLDYIWAFKAALGGDWPTVKAIFRGHRDFRHQKSQLKEKRAQVFPSGLTHLPQSGYFPKSVVWHYFVKHKTTFDQL